MGEGGLRGRKPGMLRQIERNQFLLRRHIERVAWMSLLRNSQAPHKLTPACFHQVLAEMGASPEETTVVSPGRNSRTRPLYSRSDDGVVLDADYARIRSSLKRRW